jgi:hypothetical protein
MRAGGVEQTQLYLGGVARKEGKISPLAVPACAAGIRQAFLDEHSELIYALARLSSLQAMGVAHSA